MAWPSHSMTTSSTPLDRQDVLLEHPYSHNQYEISNSETLDSRCDTRRGLEPVRELRHVPPSFTDDSRPSTADSFTTSSSDLIFSRAPLVSEIPLDARPPSTGPWSPVDEGFPSSPDDEVDSLTQDSANFETLSTIPSAQPISPRPLPSPLEFSVSQMSGGLPSPPLTQPQYNSFLDHPTGSVESCPPTVPRQLFDNLALEADGSELFSSVLDGIARLHVTMEKDDAGRWRIRRPGGAPAGDMGL